MIVEEDRMVHKLSMPLISHAIELLRSAPFNIYRVFLQQELVEGFYGGPVRLQNLSPLYSMPSAVWQFLHRRYMWINGAAVDGMANVHEMQHNIAGLHGTRFGLPSMEVRLREWANRPMRVQVSLGAMGGRDELVCKLVFVTTNDTKHRLGSSLDSVFASIEGTCYVKSAMAPIQLTSNSSVPYFFEGT
jgi:hypothetical protein